MANIVDYIGSLNIDKKYNIVADFNKYEMVNPMVFNRSLLNYLGCTDQYLYDMYDRYREIDVNGLLKRYIDNQLITPVSEYEPFYPENFYSTWEFLCKLDLDVERDVGDMLLVDSGKEKPLGHLEATTKWFEDHTHYENNTYTRIPLNKIKLSRHDDKFYHTYRNQMTQSYPKTDNIYKAIYNYNKKINKLNNKVVISSCDNILDNLLPLLLCEKGGHIVLLINNILDDDNILSLLSVYKKYGSKPVFYKPKCAHPLDPGYCIYFQKTKELDKSDVTYILDLLVGKKETNTEANKQIEKIRLDYDNSLVEFFSFWREKEMNIINGLEDKSVGQDGCKHAEQWCKDNDLIFRINDYVDQFDHSYKTFQFSNYKLNKTTTTTSATTFYPNQHKLKRELNSWKRIIDTKEQFINNNLDKDIIDWNKLTDCIDVYRNLKKILAWKFGSEMTTNAWTKFYEIFMNEHFCKNGTEYFKTFHLCEAPGAFISATNHALCTVDPDINFEWYAQSLNPNSCKNQSQYPSMLEDQYGMIFNNRQRWLFGTNGTGDITNVDNIKSYGSNKTLADVDLITGDGGLRVPSNLFNEQERYISQIVFAEIMTVLEVLPKGKDCVFKMFIPFAEPITISSLYLLTTLFDELKIVKPQTSHPSSSEVYCVGKKYHGRTSIPKTVYNKMYGIMTKFNPDENVVAVDPKFLKELEKCSRYFCSSQIESIKRSMYYRKTYYYDYDLQNDMTHLREQLTNQWISSNGIKMLPSERKLLKNKNKKVQKYIRVAN